jgi:hypothetical protein
LEASDPSAGASTWTHLAGPGLRRPRRQGEGGALGLCIARQREFNAQLKQEFTARIEQLLAENGHANVAAAATPAASGGRLD